MAVNRIYFRGDTTGGAVTALDAISGADLVSGDKGHVYSTDHPGLLDYKLTTDASTEHAPWVITPDTTPGSWAWKYRPGINGFTERINTTGGTMKAYGVSRLSMSDSEATIFIGLPANGARKDILIECGTSTLLNIISTGASFGAGSTIHKIISDSEPASKTLGNQISLVSTGAVWRFLNIRTTANISLTSAIT